MWFRSLKNMPFGSLTIGKLFTNFVNSLHQNHPPSTSFLRHLTPDQGQGQGQGQGKGLSQGKDQDQEKGQYLGTKQGQGQGQVQGHGQGQGSNQGEDQHPGKGQYLGAK